MRKAILGILLFALIILLINQIHEQQPAQLIESAIDKQIEIDREYNGYRILCGINDPSLHHNDLFLQKKYDWYVIKKDTSIIILRTPTSFKLFYNIGDTIKY